MFNTFSKLYMQLTAVRHLRTSTVHRFRNKYLPTNNTGVYRRLKMIEEDEADVIDKSEIDLEDVEGMEEDFMQAGDMSDEIMSDIERMKNVQRYKMAERKYFKAPKEPNMLTWSEKEQIRLLHHEEPEKWTPITLAESFPASPDIIRKILKNKWKPSTAERVIHHDRKVSENWIAFHKGELEIHNGRLRAHLEKFTDRKSGVRAASLEEAKKATEVIMPKPKKTEFLNLISSFRVADQSKKLENDEKIMEDKRDLYEQVEKPTHLMLKGKSKKDLTLSKLRDKLEKGLEKVSDPPEDIKAMIGARTPDPSGGSDPTYVAPSERFIPDAEVYQRRNKSVLKVINPDDMPDKIQIPKDKWKPGLVYRVNDCFYCDEGNFLYRVPGLKT